MTSEELFNKIDMMDPYDHERMRDLLYMLTEIVMRLEKDIASLAANAVTRQGPL